MDKEAQAEIERYFCNKKRAELNQEPIDLIDSPTRTAGAGLLYPIRNTTNRIYLTSRLTSFL